MKLERKGPAQGQVEYQWRVDRENGFETAKLMYDSDGRLMAVDYGSRKTPARDVVAGSPHPSSRSLQSE
ncbi:MAG TPA: hypothetical protein VF608_04750 [Thermoanaerobaculia bacterium]